LKIERSDGAYADIFDDIHAIRDNPDTYDIFSDTLFTIGETYLPVQNFTKLLLTVTPGDTIIYNGKSISVSKTASFDALVNLDSDIRINQDMTTNLIITCITDSMLTKEIDHFLYRHFYRIENVSIIKQIE